MSRTTRASVAAALLLPAVLALAACGGGTTTATPTPTPPGAGTVSTAPSVDPGVSVDPEQPIPSFDLGTLTGGLPGVDSYRTTTSTGGVLSYESVVVKQPVLSKAITTFEDDGTIEERFVIIDKAVWRAEGADGEFESVPETLAASMLMLFDPTLLFGAYANMPWGEIAGDQGVEDKNGLKARHLRIDSTSPGMAASLPAGSALDVWVAEAGYLVAWEMTGFGAGQDISIQVTNVNDPANKVEAP